MRMEQRHGMEPRCPFCGRLFERPYEIKTKLGNRFSGGRCECGAVYAFDRTGHTLGEAYVDALTFACDDDWEKAWALTPEIDYRIESLEYDWKSHSLVKRTEPRGYVHENICFVLLKKDR